MATTSKEKTKAVTQANTITEQKPNVRLPATGFVRIDTILQFIPIGRSTLWARVKAGTFPAAHKLGPKTTAWKAESVHQWIKNIENAQVQA